MGRGRHKRGFESYRRACRRPLKWAELDCFVEDPGNVIRRRRGTPPSYTPIGSTPLINIRQSDPPEERHRFRTVISLAECPSLRKCKETVKSLNL